MVENQSRLGQAQLSLAAAAALAAMAAAAGQHAAAPAAPLDWRTAEAGVLEDQVQLTFPDQFIKAGEAYFDPTTSWIIFQAVPVPEPGEPAADFYTMYVARLIKDSEGRILGIEEPIQVSAPGSANTCGWFHPQEPWRVIFGSTIEPPAAPEESPGYQRGTSRYVWQFPAQTEIVSTEVRQIWDSLHPQQWYSPARPPATAPAGQPVFAQPGYDAECSFSPDGRHILFASMVEPATENLDIFVYDTATGKTIPLVAAPGYDGGPFFSPDGTRICYRSDRAGNDLLQLYVADLAIDDSGGITGIEREVQLTDNEHVNWAPFWHPSGEFLIYTTSELGHRNYEVFVIPVPPHGSTAAPDNVPHQRITHAGGFDGLPVFNADGSYMMWTSQRGGALGEEGGSSSQIWAARVVGEW